MMQNTAEGVGRRRTRNPRGPRERRGFLLLPGCLLKGQPLLRLLEPLNEQTRAGNVRDSGALELDLRLLHDVVHRQEVPGHLLDTGMLLGLGLQGGNDRGR